MNILIENASFYSFLDDNFEKDVNIFIKDGKINKIFSKKKNISEISKKYGIDYYIDAKHKIIIPGLINAHMHFYGSYAAGLTNIKESTNFVDILNNLWWKLDAALTDDAVKFSALGYIENAIKHGTTTIIDHHCSPNAIKDSLKTIADIALDAGIRLSTCFEVSDRNGRSITEKSIKENIEFYKYTKKLKSKLLHSMFGLHASFTLPDDVLEFIKQETKNLDIGYHIHVAEDAADQQDAKEKGYNNVVERLHKFGITGEKSIFAHCVHISDEEIEILKNTNTIVVNNPQSNMNNAVGVANIKKMLDSGILLGLGSDGMTVNMFEELRCALWQQKLINKAPHLYFGEVCKMLFHNNYLIANKLFGTKLGYIQERADADLILIDYIEPTPMNKNNFYGHLLFRISQEIVDTTIVNGKLLMVNKQIINKKLFEELKDSEESAKKVWKNFDKLNKGKENG